MGINRAIRQNFANPPAAKKAPLASQIPSPNLVATFPATAKASRPAAWHQNGPVPAKFAAVEQKLRSRARTPLGTESSNPSASNRVNPNEAGKVTAGESVQSNQMLRHTAGGVEVRIGACPPRLPCATVARHVTGIVMMDRELIPKTGKLSVDEDHRHIIDFINLIEKADMAKLDEKVSADLIMRLVEFLKAHFQREEIIMNMTEYHLRREHIANHAAMVETLDLMLKEFIASGNKSTLMQYIADWYRHHAKTDERLLADYLSPMDGAERASARQAFGLRR